MLTYKSIPVRGADDLELGLYWAVLCTVRDERWVELQPSVPLRAGRPERQRGVWLGTREGVTRTVLELVCIEQAPHRRWVRWAKPEEWERGTPAPLPPVRHLLLVTPEEWDEPEA